MRIILGLGGNLGEPPRAFHAALASLGEAHRVLARSSLYRSDPVGPPQPGYWNAAALLETGTSLLALLVACQRLEEEAGRIRGGVRWGPRPLDLDLLVAEGVVHRGPDLELPHRSLEERAFALAPAAELAPQWVHPLRGATLAQLAARLPNVGLERLGIAW